MFDFGAVKKSVDSLDERLKNLDAEIRAVQAQRDNITNAPAARADVRQLVERWIDTRAAGWAHDVATTLRPFIVRPVSPSARLRQNLISIVDPIDPQGTSPISAAAVDRMLCALFRDQIVDALHAVIDGATEWPAEGLPFDQRPDATADLDAKLAELAAEQTRLREQAAELGLNRF
jgi:hypothetical protein